MIQDKISVAFKTVDISILVSFWKSEAVHIYSWT